MRTDAEGAVLPMAAMERRPDTCGDGCGYADQECGDGESKGVGGNAEGRYE